MVVMGWNFMGKNLEHLPFFIQGNDLFTMPHGPCIMCSIIHWCNYGSVIGQGILANITLLI